MTLGNNFQVTFQYKRIKKLAAFEVFHIFGEINIKYSNTKNEYCKGILGHFTRILHNFRFVDSNQASKNSATTQ